MKLIYGIKDKPKFSQRIVFAFQQLLAIMAATLAVPAIINGAMGVDMDPAAALFGAGIGTIVYLLFTRSKSPVFLGSSFAFIGSMCSAFAGAASVGLGYLGLILGAALVLTTVVGYSCMSGFIGGGGLGDIAIRYGYYRYQADIMLVTVAILIIIVQVIQESGNRISLKTDKRIR